MIAALDATVNDCEIALSKGKFHVAQGKPLDAPEKRPKRYCNFGMDMAANADAEEKLICQLPPITTSSGNESAVREALLIATVLLERRIFSKGAETVVQANKVDKPCNMELPRFAPTMSV